MTDPPPGPPDERGPGGWFDVVEREVRYVGYSTIRVDRLRTPAGDVVEREVIEHDDAVAVVPVMDDGTVVLLRQYRHPFAIYQLEIPAGKLDVAGEGIVEAARRELAEEAGLRATRLEHLLTFRNSAGWTDEVTHLYLGTGLESVGQPAGYQPEAEEAAMEIVRLPLAVAVDEAAAGGIPDAKTLLGLLLAARYLAPCKPQQN